MTLVEVGAVVVLGYVAFVGVMEAVIGTIQPDMEGGVVLATTDTAGETKTVTLAGFEFEDQLYISSNHWLRGWYKRARANPEVEVTIDGVPTARIAVPIDGAERERVAEAYRMGFVLRFVCGFAPSRFLRLDPPS